MKTNRLILRKLQIEDELSFQHAFREFQRKEPEWPFAFDYDPSMRFSDYLHRLECWSKGIDLPEMFVPSTYLVAAAGSKIVGRVSLRHELNDFLAHLGGHVGYGVVPAERRQGYGSEMLKLTLPIAASVGISRMLVTCDDDNIGSRRIIENNGGVIDGFAEKPGLKVPKRRYWIDVLKHFR